MTTYGVYRKDLGTVCISGVSLETARAYRGTGQVVCSERFHWIGIRIRIQFDFLFRFWKLGRDIDGERFFLGPLSFAFQRVGHKWADKIVDDGEENGLCGRKERKNS